MNEIPASELILNKDGSIYHLNLLPEDIAETVIIVGDPERVPQVSKYFDRIDLKKQKREFITHTGMLGNKRLTVLSTGMSTDNIDIVFNELDALANIDLKTRLVKSSPTHLNIIRIGTAGGLQQSIPTDSFVVTDYAIGMDGLGNAYESFPTTDETELRKAFVEHFANEMAVNNSYVAKGDPKLVKLLGQQHITGITVTCGGFYGPQGRILRLKPKISDFIPKLQQFRWHKHQIANFEMETAGIYALGELLGHRCCSISAIIANRTTGQFSADYQKTVTKLIEYVLNKIGVAANHEIA